MHAGLQNSEGVGLISYNSATLVTLGGCPLENRVYQYTIADSSPEAICKVNPDTGLMSAELGPASSTYMCKVRAVAGWHVHTLVPHCFGNMTVSVKPTSGLMM